MSSFQRIRMSRLPSAVASNARSTSSTRVPATAVLAVVLAFGEWRLPPSVAAGVALVAACAAAAAVLLVAVPNRATPAR